MYQLPFLLWRCYIRLTLIHRHHSGLEGSLKRACWRLSPQGSQCSEVKSPLTSSGDPSTYWCLAGGLVGIRRNLRSWDSLWKKVDRSVPLKGKVCSWVFSDSCVSACVCLHAWVCPSSSFLNLELCFSAPLAQHLTAHEAMSQKMKRWQATFYLVTQGVRLHSYVN